MTAPGIAAGGFQVLGAKLPRSHDGHPPPAREFTHTLNPEPRVPLRQAAPGPIQLPIPQEQAETTSHPGIAPATTFTLPRPAAITNEARGRRSGARSSPVPGALPCPAVRGLHRGFVGLMARVHVADELIGSEVCVVVHPLLDMMNLLGRLMGL